MQSPVHNRDRSRSGVCDRLVTSNRMHIDENIANNGQPTDNTRVIVDEGNCTSLQVQMAMRNGQSRPGKRPIKNVSPADKIDAIDRVHDGESKASVARDIGIPESTLRGWCKSEHKIRSQCSNMSTETITRHCPISNGRSMTANSRQSVNSRNSSNNRQSLDTASDNDVSVSKRAKIERTSRHQNRSQTVMPNPSTSSTGDYMNQGINQGINPNYPALIASSMANSMAAMSLHEQHQMYALLTSLKEIMLQRNNSIAPVEDKLHGAGANNITIDSSSSTINNTTDNIRSIECVPTMMKNMVGNAMENVLNGNNGNKNIAVTPTENTTNSYTRKSPSMTPTTPVSTSPNENGAHPKKIDNTYDGAHISSNESWTWFVQQVLNTQRIRGHNVGDVSNMLNLRKDWYWQYAKWRKLAKSQCTTESTLTYLDLLFNNNNFDNIVSDDSSEDRTRSHSVASERSDSHEEHEDSSVTASTAEGAALTAPVTEPKLSSEVIKMLQVAKTIPSNSDIEKAIKYGTWLQEWLNNCSIPLLTRKQVLEHKYILDVLKWFKNSQSTAQAKVMPESMAPTGPHDEGRQL